MRTSSARISGVGALFVVAFMVFAVACVMPPAKPPSTADQGQPAQVAAGAPPQCRRAVMSQPRPHPAWRLRREWFAMTPSPSPRERRSHFNVGRITNSLGWLHREFGDFSYNGQRTSRQRV